MASRSIASRAFGAYATARRAWWRASDARRLTDNDRIVFEHLRAVGALDRFRDGRILEIGPKHGEDSRLLATVGPRELVLLDLPEKNALVRSWLADVEPLAPTRYVEGNLLYLPPDELAALGSFDLVWCLGVLYHNVEQLRLLRKLFELTAPDGTVVVESATTRDRLLARRNVVEVHWPELYRGSRTITHLPSRRAIRSWLEMVGFADVRVLDVYSRHLAWQRAVLTATRPAEPRPYESYRVDGENAWVAGDAA